MTLLVCAHLNATRNTDEGENPPPSVEENVTVMIDQSSVGYDFSHIQSPIAALPPPHPEHLSVCQEHRGGKSSGASEGSVPAENHNEPFHSVLPEEHQQPSA